MKKGIVLEGGSMRGLFTAGVLDVLMEHEVCFDGAIGVSAGACFGCNLKSKQIGRTIRYNLAYCKDPRYAGFRSLITTGDLYGVDFCYNIIPNQLDPFDKKTFSENPMVFEVVCTDVETGLPVYHQLQDGETEDLAWIRASASMPLVSRVVEIGEFHLLDGGISDAVPLLHFEEEGYEKNVVILTQPNGYEKKPSRLLPAFQLFLRKYPAIIAKMSDRHLRYNAQRKEIAKREAMGNAFVIRPDYALDIAAVEHNPQKIQTVYDHGREVGEREWKRVWQFLSETNNKGATASEQKLSEGD